MGRNIIVLADGTGQRGGRLFDERRSNIYKIYRSVRCAPDSIVDPGRQLAYYDAGLGTLPGGIDSPVALLRSFLNLSSQATGLGIVGNIIDCYAALVKLWQPDDRISCLASAAARTPYAVLAACWRCAGCQRRWPTAHHSSAIAVRPARSPPKPLRTSTISPTRGH